MSSSRAMRLFSTPSLASRHAVAAPSEARYSSDSSLSTGSTMVCTLHVGGSTAQIPCCDCACAQDSWVYHCTPMLQAATVCQGDGVTTYSSYLLLPPGSIPTVVPTQVGNPKYTCCFTCYSQWEDFTSSVLHTLGKNSLTDMCIANSLYAPLAAKSKHTTINCNMPRFKGSSMYEESGHTSSCSQLT